MGKTIIKLAIFIGMVYLIFYLGRFYLSVKSPKLLEDLKTFIHTFRQPVSKGEKKTEVIERRPPSKEEKEILDSLPQMKYNSPVFKKLEDFLHQVNLKNLIQKFKSAKKSKGIIESR